MSNFSDDYYRDDHKESIDGHIKNVLDTVYKKIISTVEIRHECSQLWPDKIRAIKKCKAMTGWGLVESKEFVDAFWEKL